MIFYYLNILIERLGDRLVVVIESSQTILCWLTGDKFGGMNANIVGWVFAVRFSSPLLDDDGLIVLWLRQPLLPWRAPNNSRLCAFKGFAAWVGRCSFFRKWFMLFLVVFHHLTFSSDSHQRFHTGTLLMLPPLALQQHAQCLKYLMKLSSSRSAQSLTWISLLKGWSFFLTSSLVVAMRNFSFEEQMSGANMMKRILASMRPSWVGYSISKMAYLYTTC